MQCLHMVLILISNMEQKNLFLIRRDGPDKIRACVALQVLLSLLNRPPDCLMQNFLRLWKIFIDFARFHPKHCITQIVACQEAAKLKTKQKLQRRVTSIYLNCAWCLYIAIVNLLFHYTMCMVTIRIHSLRIIWRTQQTMNLALAVLFSQ